MSSIKLKQYVYHLVRVDFSHIIPKKYVNIYPQQKTTVVFCFPLLAAICDISYNTFLKENKQNTCNAIAILM